MSAGQGRRKGRGCWWKAFLVMLAGMIIIALAAAGVGYGLYRDLVEDLPDISRVGDYQPKQTSHVYSADGTLVERWTDDERIFRTVLAFDEIPQVMIHAILAAEDSEFYNHPGLDIRGLARAFVVNLRAGAIRQGGSTITQQVVKNLVLTPERSYRRKFQELILAYRLERDLSKDDILAIYLNEVFFGRVYYGIEEAARFYFGKSARDLEVHEAALLAGIVQAPNLLNPYRNPDGALQRRAYVLRQMYEKGFLAEHLYREAAEAPLALQQEELPWVGRVPWYVDAVRRELLAIAAETEAFSVGDVFAGGLHVHSALDLRQQALAEAALRDGLHAVDQRRGWLRPFRSLGSDADIERWLREQHREVAARGLVADQDYRAVILTSDADATVMAVGPFRGRLERSHVRRFGQGEPEVSWETLLPRGAVFTVRPLRTLPADPLPDPGDVLWRFVEAPQGAVVVMDPQTRLVRAIVGGYDFAESSFHRAVQARRQTGSAFKPFVFAAALEEQVATLATVYIDQPFTEAIVGSSDWRPSNHDGRFEGPMSVRVALARSRNTITAQLMRQVGVRPVQALARRTGIEGAMPDGLSLALGAVEVTPLELTNAYATFAAEGRYAPAGFVTRVLGPRGEVLWERQVISEERIRPELAWLMTSAMRSVVTEGTGGRAARLPQPVVGKTGTTNGIRDAWFVGYSARHVVGVWVGRDGFTPLGRGEGGSATALPIWVQVMAGLLEGEAAPDPVPVPESIETALVDRETGLLARPRATGTRQEFFLRGTAPIRHAPLVHERSADETLLHGGQLREAVDSGGEEDGAF